MTGKSFSDYEREGWDRNAERYSDVVLPATGQAFAPMLDSLGALGGRRVLEIASGTGHLAGEATARGADVVGLDVAANMVELARRRVPGAAFHLGDGEALPFDDESFDAVISSFGLLHMAHPGTAMSEAARVLKSGGPFAFTVWQAPDKGGGFLAMILGVYQAHADMDVGLPPAPPMFLLADPEAHGPMLAEAGFTEIRARTLDIVWPLHGPETVLDFIDKGAVRTSMIYDRQSPEVQQRIRDAMIEGTRPYLDKGETGIPCPAVLVTARKA